MSFWRTYYHLVWATHNRLPHIDERVEQLLFPYLHKKAAEFQATIYALSAMPDHIHLVMAIPPRYAVAEVVKSLKGASSHYLNQSGLDDDFAWQRGYGVFSLGERQRATAEAYVNGQMEHHRRGTTNAWLERVAASEEGPETNDTTLLRESPATYTALSPDDEAALI